MKTIRNILIIKGAAQYNVARNFCDELQQAFCKMGYIVSMLDLTSFQEAQTPDLFECYDMVLSFDVIGIELYNSMSNKPFFWTLLIDPPYYLHERLKLINDNVMVSCIDKRHVSYIDKYYTNIPWTCFMPHGGISGEIPKHIPFVDRKYDVVVFGSLQNINEISSVISSLKNNFDPLISDIIENALNSPRTNLSVIVSDVLNRNGVVFDDDMFREFLFQIRGIDSLRRYHKRISLIKNLIEHEIFVDIWGAGWEQFSGDLSCSSRLKLHGSVSYEEAKYIMSNSKFLVNDMPPYYEGSHERVFAAMQCGVIVATDKSTYLEDCLIDDKNVLFYDSDDIEALSFRIKKLIYDPRTAESIISNASQISNKHSWEARSRAILEIINMLHE